MSWEVDSNPWDTLDLGGDVWPGVWDVRPGNFRRSIQKRKSKGKDGGHIRDQGMEIPTVKCVGQITSENWEPTKALLRRHSPAIPGKIRQPLPIRHPKTDALNIHTVYIEGYDLDGPGPGGALTVTLLCVQWMPQPKPVNRAKETETEPDVTQTRLAPVIDPAIRPGAAAVNDAFGSQPSLAPFGAV